MRCCGTAPPCASGCVSLLPSESRCCDIGSDTVWGLAMSYRPRGLKEDALADMSGFPALLTSFSRYAKFPGRKFTQLRALRAVSGLPCPNTSVSRCRAFLGGTPPGTNPVFSQPQRLCRVWHEMYTHPRISSGGGMLTVIRDGVEWERPRFAKVKHFRIGPLARRECQLSGGSHRFTVMFAGRIPLFYFACT